MGTSHLELFAQNNCRKFAQIIEIGFLHVNATEIGLHLNLQFVYISLYFEISVNRQFQENESVKRIVQEKTVFAVLQSFLST